MARRKERKEDLERFNETTNRVTQNILSVYDRIIIEIHSIERHISPSRGRSRRGIPLSQSDIPQYRLTSDVILEHVETLKDLINTLHVDLDLFIDTDYKLIINPLAEISAILKKIEYGKKRMEERFDTYYENKMNEVQDVWMNKFIPELAKKTIREEIGRYMAKRCQDMCEFGFNTLTAKRISSFLDRLMYRFGRYEQVFTNEQTDMIYDIMEDLNKAIEKGDAELYHDTILDLIELTDKMILPTISRRIP